MTSTNSLTDQTIILAGSGRSGTTWLGNIIAANPNIGILFEPFDNRRVPEVAPLKLINYAREDGSYPQWEPVVKDALTGKITNDWVNQQKRRTHMFVRKHLVKAIRANLMLGWISNLFQPKVVFTMRHPCSVILSRMKLNWTTSLNHFLSQDELVEDYLSPYVDWLHQDHDEVTLQAIVWCIENIVPLSQMDRHDWIVCPYEVLVRQPEATSNYVLHGLGIRPSWFTQRALNQVSMVTRPDSAINTGRDPLADWQHKLAAEDISKILSVLERFEIGVYTDQVMPNLELPWAT